MLQIFFFIFVCLLARQSHAYPDFIGYGYTTCITCHYNSQGNGPLTDYGRALFSQEIAARNFWTSKDKSDEDVAQNYSGFVPGASLPWWFRPAIKYRGLWFQTNPGSKQAVERWIDMQRDIDLVISFDKAYRTVLVVNYGLLAVPDTDYYGNSNKISAVSREHYLRTYLGRKLLVAVGLMDKAYGLRTADHTSYSRGAIGLGQDDQVHGLLLHWMENDWDTSLHLYAGNLSQPEDDRKSGGAMMFEYSLAERDRIGASFLTEKNKKIDSKRLALHNRWGFSKGHGSSILFELGLKQDQLDGAEAKLGTYGLIQSLVNITRGYNFLTVIERSQAESKFSSPELQRWTFGFVAFPFQRTEARFTAVQYKNFSPETVSKDQWQLQGQVHVSW
ncbi:MAG: hypothetical protein ACXVCP_09680 [Bdellovibrio sp.]